MTAKSEQIVYKSWQEFRLRLVPSRTTRDTTTMARLKADIAKRGIRNPIRVNTAGEVISGEGRCICAQELRLDKVPCIVMDRPLTESEQIDEDIQDNEISEKLNPIDLAEKYQRKMSLEKWCQIRLARHFGVSQGDVSRTLKLKKHPEEVKALIISAQLRAGHAYQISRLTTDQQKIDTAKRCVAEEWDRSRTTNEVNHILGGTKRKARPVRIAYSGFSGTAPGNSDLAFYERLGKSFIEVVQKMQKNNIPAELFPQMLRQLAS